MQIYELKLKPISSWITDLTADTIFGHLCWQIKYEFWDKVLEKFLEDMKEKPIFTISDVLPADRLPRPLSEFDSEINEITKRWYKRNKRYKNISLISILDFKNYFLDKKINSGNILNANDVVRYGNIYANDVARYGNIYANDVARYGNVLIDYGSLTHV